MIRPDKTPRGELGKLIVEEFRERYNAMRPRHRRWLECYMFAIQSEQWLQATPVNKDYPLELTYAQEGTRVTVDKLGLLTERVQAAIQQRQPRAVPLPRTGESDDKDAAEMCDFANRYLWHAEQIAQCYNDLGLYLPLFGTGFWFVQWKADHGPRLRVNLDEEMELGLERGEDRAAWEQLLKDAKEMGSVKKTKEGLIFDGKPGQPLEFVEMPQCVFFNRGATIKPETWLYVMRATIVPMTWFEDNYPNKEVKPLGESSYESLWMAEGITSEVQPAAATATGISGKDWGLLIDIRFPPRKAYERGKWMLVAGEEGTILTKEKEEVSDFEDGWIGVHPVRWRPDPRSPYGIGMVELGKPAQEELNDAVTVVAEYAAKAGGVLASPRGIELQHVQGPLRRLEYDPTLIADKSAFVPHVIGPTTPSPIIFKRIEFILQHMNEIARDPSGALSAGLPKTRSAIHAGVLNEMAAKGMEQLIGQLVALEEKTTSARIELIRNNWALPVGLRILGEGSEPQVKTFWSKKIEYGVDFRVTEVPDNLFSRSVHDAKMLQLFEIGAFGDPRLGAPGSKNAVLDFLKAITVPTPSTMQKQTAIARNQAKAETEHMLTTGEALPVYPWHDHEVHTNTHYEEANQPKYKDVPEEGKQALLQHDQAHQAMRKDSLEGQLQRAMQEREELAKQVQQLEQYAGVLQDQNAAGAEDREELLAMAAENAPAGALGALEE